MVEVRKGRKEERMVDKKFLSNLAIDLQTISISARVLAEHPDGLAALEAFRKSFSFVDEFGVRSKDVPPELEQVMVLWKLGMVGTDETGRLVNEVDEGTYVFENGTWR